MKVAGHQPDYLPYLGFFARMLEADVFVVVDHVQFEKKSFQSRNRIRSAAGATLLSVPVRTGGRCSQPITDVAITDDVGRWRRKHWRALVHNYHRAPYFSSHTAFFEEMFAQPWSRLVDLNMAIIDYLAGRLGMQRPIFRSSRLRRPLGGRNDLLVDLCTAFGGDEYLSGPGGRNYVDDAYLRARGIRSSYTTFAHPVYAQVHQPFLENMAAVDLLFNEGPEAAAILARSVTR